MGAAQLGLMCLHSWSACQRQGVSPVGRALLKSIILTGLLSYHEDSEANVTPPSMDSDWPGLEVS